jgi:hypothetical protein
LHRGKRPPAANRLLVFLAGDLERAIQDSYFDRSSILHSSSSGSLVSSVSRRVRASCYLFGQLLVCALRYGQLLSVTLGCLCVDDGIAYKLADFFVKDVELGFHRHTIVKKILMRQLLTFFFECSLACALLRLAPALWRPAWIRARSEGHCDIGVARRFLSQ